MNFLNINETKIDFKLRYSINMYFLGKNYQDFTFGQVLQLNVFFKFTCKYENKNNFMPLFN